MKAIGKSRGTDRQQKKFTENLWEQEHRKEGGTMTLGGGAYSLERKQNVQVIVQAPGYSNLGKNTET